MKLTLNEQQQTLEYDVDMTTSLLLDGCCSNSYYEINDNKLLCGLVGLRGGDELLLVDNFQAQRRLY